MESLDQGHFGTSHYLCPSQEVVEVKHTSSWEVGPFLGGSMIRGFTVCKWVSSLLYSYFKMEQNASAAVTVLLTGVGALLTQRRRARGRETTTRV